MKQKNTMRIWQFVLLSLLLLFLGASMFLPVFHINGKVIMKAEKKVAADSEEYQSYLEEITEEDGDFIKEEEIKEMEQNFDETIREYEKENGVSIRSISSFQIMTHSFQRLVKGRELTAEEKKLQKENPASVKMYQRYHILRIVLWIVYMAAFAILFLAVLGMALDWVKYIIASLSMLYGVVSIAVFAYLRFGLAGTIAKILSYENTSLADFGDFLSMGDTAGAFKKCLSAFYSIGFLVGFILSILLVVSSLLTMLLGNKEYPNHSPFSPILPNEPSFTPESPFTPEPVIPSVPPISSKQSILPVSPVSVGQVKCTKGIVAGQGFQLPADRKVIVGKSPQNANLVINHPNVSNIHCSIRYNPNHNSYIVKDHSLNGTFVNGVRLQKDIPMEYPAGTILSLADGTNQVTLG